MYCERLPCPCLRPGGGVSGGGGRAGAGREPAVPGAGKGHPVLFRGARIDAVIDGDTIDARLADGRRQRVRLVGIDAPESTTLRTGRAECGGQDAKHTDERLAERWPRISLQSDPTQDAYDQYGRLLAYVVPDDAPQTTFQEQMLLAGWAKVYVFDGHPFQRARAFRAAAARARTSRLGVWQRCGGDFRRPLT